MDPPRSYPPDPSGGGGGGGGSLAAANNAVSPPLSPALSPMPTNTFDDESDSEIETPMEPRQFAVRRRKGLCAEPMIKGYFKEPFWNKHEKWSVSLLKQLSRSVIFKHNTRDEVLKMVRAMSTHLSMKDECICQQGDKLDSLMIVLEGSVQSYKQHVSEDGSKPEPPVLWQTYSAGAILDESAVIWATPRPYSLYASEDNTIIARLYREDYLNLSIRFRYYKRGAHQDMIHNTKLLELLADEQTAAIADVLQVRNYSSSASIIRQGEEGKEMYFVDDGEAKVWQRRDDNDVELCRYHRGALFGELALLKNAPRAANVTAVTKMLVLVLGRRQFERILGPMAELQAKQYASDPRKLIADFYTQGDSRGPLGSLKQRGLAVERHLGESQWFVVYRPTSRDAIAKMLNGNGVGKGLNVKGKSAKEGCLSGFVPFVQVSDNKHKPMIEQSPPHARTKVYYKSNAARLEAKMKVEAVRAECTQLKMDSSEIFMLDEYAPDVFGMSIPEALVREAYIMRPDLSPVFGWETGRRSEPFSMDMNLHGVRGENGKIPEVVVFQYDQMDVMNPRGLLIAYAEKFVKPVVSDFDTFTVASKGMLYEKLPEDQGNLITWSLEHTEAILASPDHQNWTSRWIDVLRKENERGFHPHLPLYGFGDPTSYEMVGQVVIATEACGAVRHGAECFNFYFPQELDDEFLVVWTEFPQKPWAYFTEEKLRAFLMERINDGYAFPVNAVWPVRDKGWFEVFEALKKSAEGKKVLPSWYLPQLRLEERIQTLHKQFPKCFTQQAEKTKDEEDSKKRRTKEPKQAAEPRPAADLPTAFQDAPAAIQQKKSASPACVIS
eukprot:TRINITY_DN600_c0_g3_i1.p1 TRINITY_DN600_c0_g3~~TRINITY_DN600_c0_g3_i1.p1  ORF type:complete len:836 (+),score=202.96 TRINITY_DN600_c0_g3_i1:169-2676(+)